MINNTQVGCNSNGYWIWFLHGATCCWCQQVYSMIQHENVRYTSLTMKYTCLVKLLLNHCNKFRPRQFHIPNRFTAEQSHPRRRPMSLIVKQSNRGSMDCDPITQTAREPVWDAKNLFATNIQLPLRIGRIATFACNTTYGMFVSTWNKNKRFIVPIITMKTMAWYLWLFNHEYDEWPMHILIMINLLSPFHKRLIWSY